MRKLFGKVILLLLIAAGFALHRPAAERIPEERKAVIRRNVANATLRTEIELPVNYLGRFTVPAAGVDVACYESSAQSVVDARDSAAYFYACGHWIIADHVHQGFGAIKGCKAGNTAYLETERGRTEYTCVDTIQGHNTGKELTDGDYQPIDELYPDTLVCYTCNDNWQNVTIVFFAPA